MTINYHTHCACAQLAAQYGAMRRVFSITFVAFMLAWGVVPLALAWEEGEALYYRISWGWLTAGAAELRFENMAEEKYRITARAWTTGGPATLKERLQSVGVVTAEGLQPEHYVQQQIENSYRAHKTLDFMPAEGTEKQVFYDSKLDAAAPYGYAVPVGAQDMLTALYHLRKLGGTGVAGTYDLDVVTLGDIKPMTVTVSEPKLLRVRTLREDKFVVREVRPYVADSKQDWVIYVTDDADLRPIQIELRSGFGTFKARLAYIDGESKVPGSIPLDADLF